ncbi:MAG: ribonuclease E/G [Lachnospiraceae bacterium]|nr:ribonuclease E/G [Lachnospiraceae bacterium]
MERKLIITRQNERIVTALFENGRAVELGCYNENVPSLLGNIYIGRVKNVTRNIGAAFIEISKGVTCYYPLDDCKRPIYTKKGKSPHLEAGDELLVQVSREAAKTKPPSVTANLNFTGKYLVLTTGKQQVGVSAKLGPQIRCRLKTLIEESGIGEYGFIVRTNAGNASDREILREMETLKGHCQKLTERAQFLSCFSLLSEPSPSWLEALRDTRTEGLSAITTDDPELHGKMKEYLELHQPGDLQLLCLYKDALLPLDKLYNLGGELQNALREKVWMKSGAYLVIQPTEALTVIDVNTGKYESKKKRQDTYLKINLEAAGEIARQLRLRNLSGIIVVDFINMDSQEAKQELMEYLEACLRQDRIKTVLVDMTVLNLVEITRKKVRKPLAEQMGEVGR